MKDKNIGSFFFFFTSTELVISTCFETIILDPAARTTSNTKKTIRLGIPLGNDPTLAFHYIGEKGWVIHVTASRVRLFGHYCSLDEWRPPFGETITIAKVNDTQCIVSYGRDMLVYLVVVGPVLMEVR